MKNTSMTQYTKEERLRMLSEMKRVASTFYAMAVHTHCHAMIEFTGLMNEYIKICEDAEAQGIDWVFANTHSGVALPMESYHLEYLAEKLDCIFGPALQDPKNRDVFLKALFPWNVDGAITRRHSSEHPNGG